MLSTDNDSSFTSQVVEQLIQILGVSHVLGTAYHPQSQSPVERPHREFNSICKAFMEEYEDWDLQVPIFVWAMRTTTKLFNGHFIPYECITGMKPRSPIDALVASGAVVEKITHDRYVKDLIVYLRKPQIRG